MSSVLVTPQVVTPSGSVWAAYALTGLATNTIGVWGYIRRTSGGNAVIGVRTPGVTTDISGLSVGPEIRFFACGVNGSDQIELFASGFEAVVLGELAASDAVFLAGALPALTHTPGGDWQSNDIAAATGTDTAIAAVVWCSEIFGAAFRPTGSTDDRYPNETLVGMRLVGCDGSERFDSKLAGGGQTFYLTGYFKGALTWVDPAADRSLATTGSYQALTALPTNAIAGVYDVTGVTTGDTVAMRRPGDTQDDYLAFRKHTQLVIPADGSRIVEAKISTADVDLYLQGYLQASFPEISGATSISHGQTVALTIANADLGDRTITIRQGALVLTIAEEAGGTNTACNIVAAMERVDPLPSIFRNVSAQIRVTRISDGEYAQYSFTPVDPAQQTSVILTSIEAVAANRITATPDIVAGDHLHARPVGGVGSLPAGLVLNADATFAEDAAVNFDVRSQDAATGVLSAWALQTAVAGIAPSITTQPTNQTVSEGATATFSVVATGDAPLAYQWQKNLSNIVGATSATYVTPATLLGDNGSTYRCRVTNAYGSVNSNTATLTVSAVSPGDIIPPSVPTGLVATVIDQTRVHLSWNPSTDTGGSGLSGYRIYRNGFPIGSSPVASLVDSTIIASGSYTYQVSAFDYAGNESDLSLPPVLVDNLQIIIPQSYIMDSGFGVVRRRRRFH